MRRKWWGWIGGLLAVLWLATGLRLYRLDAQSFWNDEGNSARLSERPPAAILEGTASDIHPPLYYLALRGWRVGAGESEFGLRSFSAYAGVLTVAVTIALARRLAPGGGYGPVVWLAGALAAVNPALIYYSQEARMYALLALEAAAATWWLWCWWRRPGRRLAAAAYVVVTAAGLYTHYFYPAVLAGQAALVLVWQVETWRAGAPRWRQAAGWLGLVGMAGLLYLPWLSIFWRQAGGRVDAAAPITFPLDALRWLAYGHTLPATAATWATPAAAAVLLLGAAGSGRRALAPVIMVLLPAAFMMLAGTTQPEFYKFLLVAAPFAALLAAQAVAPDRARPRPATQLALALALPALAGQLAASGLAWSAMVTDPDYARADYRGIAARIAAAAYPNAGIVLTAPNQWEVFTYYHRQGAPVYPLPRGQPRPELVIPELEAIAARHRRLYALFWGEAQRDPQRLVEQWLDTHGFKAAEEWVGDVRFVLYAMPDAPPVGMETATELAFGPDITLRGYAVNGTEVAPGDILQVTLFWRAAAPVATRYKVFLHVTGPDGALLAQRDAEPVGGLKPTINWEPGVVITDNHGILLPLDLPPGRYTVKLGLYEAANPTVRLPIAAPGGTVDAYPLMEITVLP